MHYVKTHQGRGHQQVRISKSHCGTENFLFGIGKAKLLFNFKIKKELFRHPERKSNVGKSDCSQIFPQ